MQNYPTSHYWNTQKVFYSITAFKSLLLNSEFLKIITPVFNLEIANSVFLYFEAFLILHYVKQDKIRGSYRVHLLNLSILQILHLHQST